MSSSIVKLKEILVLFMVLGDVECLVCNKVYVGLVWSFSVNRSESVSHCRPHMAKQRINDRDLFAWGGWDLFHYRRCEKGSTREISGYLVAVVIEGMRISCLLSWAV